MAKDEEAAKEAILALLEERDEGKTVCPSEAARKLDADNFRELMPTVRNAAAELAETGRIEVTQGGERVDIDSAKGPVRLRLRGDAT